MVLKEKLGNEIFNSRMGYRVIRNGNKSEKKMIFMQQKVKRKDYCDFLKDKGIFHFQKLKQI